MLVVEQLVYFGDITMHIAGRTCYAHGEHAAAPE